VLLPRGITSLEALVKLFAVILLIYRVLPTQVFGVGRVIVQSVVVIRRLKSVNRDVYVAAFTVIGACAANEPIVCRVDVTGMLVDALATLSPSVVIKTLAVLPKVPPTLN
jgi:hypothetical protein